MPLKECLLYGPLKNEAVKCLACNHYCIIKKNSFGICRVRKNILGKLFLLSYGKVSSENIDPIEKKPLYHFLPGEKAYSIGTIGCNFKCSFCQNWEISQEKNFDFCKELSPEKIVQNAIKNKCKIIAYTYNEPSISIEYWLECMKIAKKSGIKNVLVTNGYMSKESLNLCAKYIDAMNIDLKSFNEGFYNKICKAKLKPVLETIKNAHEKSIWIEISTLIIPNKNDSKKEIENIAKFLAKICPSIPIHLLRYFPSYKMKSLPTPIDKIIQAAKICKKYLLNVYYGNIGEQSSTYCENCKKELIKRVGHSAIILGLKKGKCIYCNEKFKGVIL